MSLSTSKLERLYGKYLSYFAGMVPVLECLTYEQFNVAYKVLSKYPDIIMGYYHKSYHFSMLIETFPTTITKAMPQIQDKYIEMQLEELINE